jgi:hypothetical protein
MNERHRRTPVGAMHGGRQPPHGRLLLEHFWEFAPPGGPASDLARLFPA